MSATPGNQDPRVSEVAVEASGLTVPGPEAPANGGIEGAAPSVPPTYRPKHLSCPGCGSLQYAQYGDIMYCHVCQYVAGCCD
jgi:hypothetical protein